MSSILFIVFIVSAAAIDRNPLMEAVCLETLVILNLLSKKMAPQKREEKKKMGYKPCPYCGANLDPNEKCDCRDEAATPQQENGNDGKSRLGSDKHDHINHNEKEEISNE